MSDYCRDDVAALIDHTLLKPEATEHDVARLVEEATELGVYAICVSPSMVAIAERAARAPSPSPRSSDSLRASIFRQSRPRRRALRCRRGR